MYFGIPGGEPSPLKLSLDKLRFTHDFFCLHLEGMERVW